MTEDISSLNSIDVDSIVGAIAKKQCTWVGSDVLVAISPSEELDVKESMYYAQMADEKWSDPQKVDAVVTANILEMASNTFMNMVHSQQDQTIVVRGTQGSGKSNARKKIIKQLVALSTNSKKNSKVLTGAVKMQTILQAFGHAQVSDSGNSSRYALYTEFQFSRSGRMVGIKTLDYLLEKNRITSLHSCPEGERNFNIFYQLIGGLSAEQRAELFLESDSNSYFYLQNEKRKNGTLGRKLGFGSLSRRLSSTNVTNLGIEGIKELCEHLKSIGIGKRIQSYIFQVVAAVLHLGNLQFSENTSNEEPAIIKDADVLSKVANLLGVTNSALESALTYKTQMIGTQMCSAILSLEETTARRDELATALYSHLFSWILGRVNDRLCKEESAVDNFIGILDFPSLIESDSRVGPLSLHDFCSNISFERISQYIDSKIISSRISVLKSEQLNHPDVSFVDHAPVLDLLIRPSGLAAAINEETCARRNPEVIIGSLNSRFKKDYLYLPPSSCSTAINQYVFGIRHSFATVEYSVNDFESKNTETISSDFIVLFRKNSRNDHSGMGGNESITSISDFVESLFSAANGVETETHRGNIISAHVNSTLKRNLSIKRKADNEKKSFSIKETFISGHINSLDDLMVCLSHTKIHTILCIKPFGKNSKKISLSLLRNQIEQYSILAIAKSRAFANVLIPGISYESFEAEFGTVVSKYQSMNKGIGTALDRISASMHWKANEIILGRTQIFLSESKLKWFKIQSKTAVSAGIQDYESEAGDFSEVDSDFGDFKKPKQVTIIESPKNNQSQEPPKATEHVQSEKKLSRKRKTWVCITWSLTWWIPNNFLICCGKMKRPDIRIAWREKVALCIIIFFMNAALLFLILGLRYIICPPQNIQSMSEIEGTKWVISHGRYYNYEPIRDYHLNYPSSKSGTENIKNHELSPYFGTDITYLFYKQDAFTSYCGLPRPKSNSWDYIPEFRNHPRELFPKHRFNDSNGNSIQVIGKLDRYVEGFVGWSKDYLPPAFYYIFNNVYEATPTLDQLLDAPGLERLRTAFTDPGNKNATDAYLQLYRGNRDLARDALRCLNSFYYRGILDSRNTLQCTLSNFLLLSASIVIASVIVFKFFAALRFSSPFDPEENEKFVVLMVPCYTEGQDSLSKTLESLAILNYDDKRKLLFIVCDGMIVGAGNDRPTPRIVLDILGVDSNIDPEPQAFYSLGEGNKQYNMAKVYSGLYEIRGHSVPFVVVVKVGAPGERVKPGNRGKRDSQLVLMRFFNRVHFNSGLSPMEISLYHHLKNVIGVNPTFYEFVLMVDADTEVQFDALNRMICYMVNDSKVIGLCGETQISNDKTTWVTMIQVYEYFISHHLSKAFESLFGTVTCLPGCFCMYRIRSAAKNMPVLVSNEILEEYSENNVDTLHLKNLLHLGEDRYLTTLALKHFPQMKTCFINDAKCSTSAPESWSVLLSQRRRWINSTVHNLIELTGLGQLCGFCCFSMRFVVMIDLLATFIQPAAVLYIGYLIFAVSTSREQFPLISIIVIAAVYGLQILIFLLKGEWEHIMWMIFYIIALPLFAFWIPLYSFWHFDDFSWGNTRVVVGEGKKTFYVADAEPFDPSSIPLITWSDYELSQGQKWEAGSSISEVPSFKENSLSLAVPEKSMPKAAISPNARISMFQHSTSIQNRTSPVKILNDTSRFPSDSEILAELRNVLTTADLRTVTKKQVRETLSAKFGGIDLKSKKDYINQMIDMILKGG